MAREPFGGEVASPPGGAALLGLHDSYEELDRALEIRDRTNRVATVDFMMRFTPFAGILAHCTIDKPFGEPRRAAIENHAQDETLQPNRRFMCCPSRRQHRLLDYPTL
jgi:hypothetical protein